MQEDKKKQEEAQLLEAPLIHVMLRGIGLCFEIVCLGSQKDGPGQV